MKSLLIISIMLCAFAVEARKGAKPPPANTGTSVPQPAQPVTPDLPPEPQPCGDPQNFNCNPG